MRQHILSQLQHMNTDYVWGCLAENKAHNINTRGVKRDDLLAGLCKVAEGCIEYIEEGEWGERFKDTPCIVKGLAEGWEATEKWKDQESFLKHYGDVPFKVTEMCAPMGKPLPLRITFREYFSYADTNDSDFPWYLFGDDFAGPRAPLLDDIAVPTAFASDIYASYRHFFPTYRYMVIGGDRTGTHMHTDPKYTCAFNTLLSGQKRWVLFPPHVSKADLHIGGASDPVTYWWLDVYQKILVEGGKGKELGMIDVLQNAGETIWVPTGWWHAVLNFGDTIAYTQNSLPAYKVADLWPAIVANEPQEHVAALAASIAATHPEVHAQLPSCAARQEQAKNNVVFLDVDGVLHPLRLELVNGVCASDHLFNAECMRLLKEILAEGNAKIVLSSSWRMFEHSRAKLQNAFCDHDIAPFVEWTTVMEDSAGRAGQILRYVQEHGDDINEWVVLDDEDIIGDREGMLMQVLRARWVRTDKDTGLTADDARRAVSILLDEE
eukprot:TRINITY_DN5473_c0_g1_i1.p1 TRINITY_DN5473_c0_g1~~TRINITY_DN5473_c0_g1_i1.p1  ORF type:complete len:493 (+),score=162.41 TRINITY_DN5473_c0_g1_i1:180-1658(+)